MALSRVCNKFFSTTKSVWNVNCRRYFCYRYDVPAFLANHGVVFINNCAFQSKLGS